MSHITLNRDDLLKLFTVETALDQIIRYYESQFEQKGEVICRIKLNDLQLSEEDEQKFADMPLSKINSFEVETENPNQLFHDVLNYWKAHLPLLIQSADQLAQNIRFKRIEENALELSQFIDQCHMLVNSLGSIHSLCQHRSIPLSDRWSASELKLWMAFNELLDSFSSKNFSEMADAIEYDLADTFQTWLEILSQME